MNSDQAADQKLIGSDDYPGARVVEMDSVPKKDYLPEAEDIKNDKAAPYTDGCHVAAGDPVVKVCEYGVTEDYDYTVALVGSSHATHWQPALVKMAEKNKIRVLNITKSGCRLSTYKAKDPSCIVWNKNVVNKIAAEKPDMVFANADIGYWNVHEVEKGYIEQFEALNKKELKFSEYVIRRISVKMCRLVSITTEPIARDVRLSEKNCSLNLLTGLN